MIWIFKPVNNPYWYEVRRIDFIEWKKPRIQALNIWEYAWVIHELPVFKCKKDCKPKSEYYEQFIKN